MAKKSKGKSKSSGGVANQLAEAERKIERLEADLSEAQAHVEALSERCGVTHTASNARSVDPYVLCASIGVLRDRLSGGPMDEKDFESEAPRLIQQALRLYDMLEGAIQERYSTTQAHQDEEDELEEASHKPKSPSLP